jgi:uncharacterized protein (TIGR03435 family)
MKRILIAAALMVAASPIAFGQAGGQPSEGGNSGGQVAPATAQAQQPEIKVGLPAPELKIERLIQAPTGAKADLNSLRGKVTVLEFWATWCGPCVKSFKHLNEVAERVKDKPVQFIAVTDEADATLITKFLQEQPVRAWIALDTDRSVFKAYRPLGRPSTYLIDGAGNIAAITYPENVTAVVLEDLIAGKPVSLPLKPLGDWSSTEYVPKSGDEFFQATIQPANQRGPFFSSARIAPGRWETDGVPLVVAIRTAYRVSDARLINSVPLPKEPYSFKVVVPKDREELFYPVFQQALEVTFGLKAHWETREVDAFVLKVAPDRAPGPRPSQATDSTPVYRFGFLTGKKRPIKDLAEGLEGNFLRGPVVDETGLTGEYDWDLPYNRASNKVLLEAIRTQLGLEVVKDRRRIKILVIDNFEPPRKD